ncbi:MAG: TetR/AcrR family transcriptional regulator [Mycobacterium sp.]|uniref:TetR/AcrR family transcriptional regulator n=1 Tax=Mycobacterium sp. TaxID=1785 RepID=UPI00283B4BCD|nr:TetR/AcrR family transcriptional regulator [Mycobacterium sp.]HKI39950.1 TetR/AcrR family transcriptional regulator [Mycobacterium sp.]
MNSVETPVNRLERRKQRTRSALLKAAQGLIAEGRLNVPILEITQAADVGMGSFYNHFSSKEELFEAAVMDVLGAHGALLDELTAQLEDPAQIFASSFRLTGRFFRRRPQETRILLANWQAALASEHGLAPRALRDIKAAVAAGRFTVDDPERALVIAGGVLLGLGSLLAADPDRDDARTADAVTEDLLRLFGMPAREAHKICTGPLPAIDSYE